MRVFERMEIWGIYMTISALDMLPMLSKGLPLDMYLYNTAKADGKQVGGIETVEEQIEALSGGSEEEQISQLRRALEQMKDADEDGTTVLEEMTRLYLAGDAVGLMQEVEGMGEADGGDELLEALVNVRNRRMAERAAEKIRAHPEKCFFFAFGAAHFPGTMGVVQLLCDAGFEVVRLGRDGEPLPVPRKKLLRSF
jgi:uncharacterized protein YbaP (TraB family)